MCLAKRVVDRTRPCIMRSCGSALYGYESTTGYETSNNQEKMRDLIVSISLSNIYSTPFMIIIIICYMCASVGMIDITIITTFDLPLRFIW